MRRIGRQLWMPLLAAVIVAVDQWTKGLVEAGLPLNGSFAPFPALAKYFNIVHWSNTGAAFGLLRGQNAAFVVVAVVVIIIVFVYTRFLPADDWALRTCLGIQLGGAIGNLIDRIRIGHVTDFLLFSVPVGDRVYIWPAWNVADGCIVVGTILLGVLMLWSERKRTAQAAQSHVP